MAKKITGLTELAAVPAADDLLTLVDVSDTTMDAAGTNKKIQMSNMGYLLLQPTATQVINAANADFDLLIEGTVSTYFALFDVGNEHLILGNSSGAGKLTIDGNSDEVQLLVQGNSSQTANIVEFQSSADVVLAGADERGILFSYGGIESTNFFAGEDAGRAAATGVGNTFIGQRAGDALTTGASNLGLGKDSLGLLEDGAGNAAIGATTLTQCVSGGANVAIGSSALTAATGSSNVAIGASSGIALTSGSSNIFIGRRAGQKQTTLSNLLIIHNQNNANVGLELTNSILYGVMAATPAVQTLRLNARVGVNRTPTAMLDVDQPVDDEAIPVLALDQADVSDGFINYISATAASAVNPISTWTSGNTIQGFVRVEINGANFWMPFYDAPTS